MEGDGGRVLVAGSSDGATFHPVYESPADAGYLPGRLGFTVREGGHGGEFRLANLETRDATANPVVRVKTSLGDFKIELFADKAPNAAGHFLSYVRDEWFDGTVFHLVARDCDIQTGFLGKDMQPMKPPRAITKLDENDLKSEPGTVGLVTGYGHFVVNVGNNAGWKKDCVFGRLVEGMDVVKAINAVETAKVGNPHDGAGEAGRSHLDPPGAVRPPGPAAAGHTPAAAL